MPRSQSFDCRLMQYCTFIYRTDSLGNSKNLKANNEKELIEKMNSYLLLYPTVYNMLQYF